MTFWKRLYTPEDMSPPRPDDELMQEFVESGQVTEALEIWWKFEGDQDFLDRIKLEKNRIINRG